jgi:diguanylate cyclase (GGDEF)-like protein
VLLEGLLVVLCALLAPVLSRSSARLRRHLAEMRYIATHDDVTGLQNRFGFQQELDRQIINLATLGCDRVGALLFIDLVEFGHINGVLGPEGADELLRQVGGRLGAACHADQAVVVARLGEDEFGILLRVQDHAEVLEIASRLQAALGDPFIVNDVRFVVEPRVGVALIPEHGSTREEILRAASAALNAAKHQHQSLKVFEHSHDIADRSRLELRGELREAISTDQLAVRYQPQAEFSTGTVHGAEALVRWLHPIRGTIAPDLFVPLAEDTGLITQIDRFVVERTARDWQSLVKQGTPITVAVNLSPIDLLDLDFADRIIEIINAYQPLSRHLILEITERALLSDYQHIHGSLQRLANTGARLAIDDFGTGYSSLDRLIHLPIHQIKLDRSIVAHLPGPREHEAITRTTIELAHALDATVVAEGIETREQWDYLKDAGCDVAQGYLIGRPQTATELAQLLTATADSPVAA